MPVLMPRDHRYSRAVFDWTARYCLERSAALDALTGQAATFTRTTRVAAKDSAGTSYTAAHSQPRWHWIDVDRDSVKESVAFRLTSDDAVSFPFNVLPRALTIYVLFEENGTVGGTNRLLTIGNSTTNPSLTILGNTTAYRASHHNGSAAVTSTMAAAPSTGDAVELLLTLSSTGVVQLSQTINGAAATTATASGTNTLAAAWASTATLYFNAAGASAKGDTALAVVRVALGTQTFATMREG